MIYPVPADIEPPQSVPELKTVAITISASSGVIVTVNGADINDL